MQEIEHKDQPLLESPKKKGIRIRFGHYSHKLGYGIREIFVGKRTVFSILGFIVGGILIGRSVWEYSVEYVGLGLTLVVGLIIFTLSGLALHEFGDIQSSGKADKPKDDLLV